MQYRVRTSGKVDSFKVPLPTSKSISNRVLILNALAYSPYKIDNLSDSDDTDVLLNVFNSNSNVFDIGAAGTSMRFLTAYLSRIVGEWVVTGSERMKQRPIAILVDALRKLGAEIEYTEKEGFPPLKITGVSLKGGELELAGDISSQYISAILMIAPCIEGGLTLKLTGEIISKPYIYLTLKLMEEFGVSTTWHDNAIKVPESIYKPRPYCVEGDWSAASYWYEMVALATEGSVIIESLYEKSPQGDSKVADLFSNIGVSTKFKDGYTILEKSSAIVSQFDYDFSDQPDLAQTFAVTCCALNIPFIFSGLQTLRIKESDRIYALIDELSKFGFVLATNGKDTLVWNGTKNQIEKENPINVNTYKDHRMAMAFAPLALKGFNVIIEDPMVVTKSYPKFWDHIKKCGFIIDSNY
ncbi:MAG: 3-phosphoshikimate 1-carboxyvinyltransferase [Marinilabiliaceae bacterium]|nr:3-phosphoshikimate 1-carboxyvinyltransferase [Marinilabiliaceae bacterium]